MTDVIEMRGLRVLAIHGALEEEKVRAQPFEVDLDVETSFNAPASSDDLADAVNYGVLAREVAQVMTSKQCTLLEHLAELIATAVLQHERVDAVTVAIRKLRPPIPLDIATVGVRITRRRGTITGG